MNSQEKKSYKMLSSNNISEFLIDTRQKPFNFLSLYFPIKNNEIKKREAITQKQMKWLIDNKIT
jgi:hypothetical protein